MSVYKNTKINHTEQPPIFGEPVDLQRFDIFSDPKIDKLTMVQIGQYWIPEEIDLSKDKIDFNSKMSEHEKHIFTSNLKAQIMLDSIQGRAPNLAFLPLASTPEFEAMTEWWSTFEAIHSRSYTHILRNLYSDPSPIFDDIKNIESINDRAGDISKYYDDLITKNAYRHIALNTNTNVVYNEYEHKKSFWLALHAVNALEAIRFYVSFACSFAFAENKLMTGNAKVIALICRDENLHLKFTQYLINKGLVEKDPDFIKIKNDKTVQKQCLAIMNTAINQEKQWAEYLFKDGSMLGLNVNILHQYVDYIGGIRKRSLGIQSDASRNNPLPWMSHWVNNSKVQDAPQEEEIISYTSGDVVNDVDSDSFSEFGSL